MKYIYWTFTFVLVLTAWNSFSESVNLCKIYPTLSDCNTTSFQPLLKSTRQNCEIQWKLNQCDEFASKHPDALKDGKLMDCNQPSSCSLPPTVGEHMSACAVALKDSVVDWASGLWMFATGQLGNLSEEDKKKLQYLENCTTVECKRQMLGPIFSTYFTKEEIEGHPNTQGLDPRDPAHQNYLYGFSAATLYRLLLKRMRDHPKNIQDKFIQPWSGKPAEPMKSFDDLISAVLEEAGITKTACFKPEVVTQMRCYAFFMIFDPTMAAGAASKLIRMGSMAKVATHATQEITKSVEIGLAKSVVGDSSTTIIKEIPEPPPGTIPLTKPARYFSLAETEPLRSSLSEQWSSRIREKLDQPNFKTEILVDRRFNIDNGGGGARVVLSHDMITQNELGEFVLKPGFDDSIETMVAHEAGHHALTKYYSPLRANNHGMELDFTYRSLSEMYSDLTAASYRHNPKAVDEAASVLEPSSKGRDFSPGAPTLPPDLYTKYNDLGRELWARYLASESSPARRQKILDAIARGIADELKRLEGFTEDQIREMGTASPAFRRHLMNSIEELLADDMGFSTAPTNG